MRGCSINVGWRFTITVTRRNSRKRSSILSEPSNLILAFLRRTQCMRRALETVEQLKARAPGFSLASVRRGLRSFKDKDKLLELFARAGIS